MPRSYDQTHAKAINGTIHLNIAGKMVPETPAFAFNEYFYLLHSPYESSKERAREIKAALTEVGYFDD